MEELYNKHYIEIRADGTIVAGWSDGPHPEKDTTNAICINDKGGYQFRLIIDGEPTEENPPIYTMDGITLYKYIDGEIISRSNKELEQDKIPQYIIEKGNIIRQLCHTNIIQGINITLSKGEEHFSLEETDQINLTTAAAAV